MSPIEDFDAYVRVCANRDSAAVQYGALLRAYGTGWRGWPELNAAILRRWSPSGLEYIKHRAWKIATGNL